MLTPEQLKMRLSGCGGSEAGAVVGLNRHMTPLDVYRAKTEPGYEVPMTPPMERGAFLEDGVARWFAHRTGSTLRELGTIRHPAKSFAICTPDRLATRPGQAEIDLSIKVPGPYVRERWGEEGTDNVPEESLVQLQWELLILGPLYGITRGIIAAPIDGDLRTYPIEGDPEFQGMLLERVERFWVDHVLARKPPPVDGSESCEEWLNARFPRHLDAEHVQADSEAEELARTLRAAKAAGEEAAKKEAEAKNRLKAKVELAPGMVGDGWRISWKSNKGKAVTNWAAVAQELKASPELVAKHTEEKPGPRVFRFTSNQESADE